MMIRVEKWKYWKHPEISMFRKLTEEALEYIRLVRGAALRYRISGQVWDNCLDLNVYVLYTQHNTETSEILNEKELEL